MLLRFDGASRGNPGIGGSGAVLYYDNTILKTCYMYHSLSVTNNISEYYGLIIGMRMAVMEGITNLTIEGDSKLVIEQVFGKWKCNNPNMILLNNEAIELKKLFNSINGKWIPREQNKDADKASNDAIDTKSNFGDESLFITVNLSLKQNKRNHKSHLTILEAFKK